MLPILADNPQHDNSETDSRPLDELLAFIEGDEEGEGSGVSSVSMTTNNTPSLGRKKRHKNPCKKNFVSSICSLITYLSMVP